MHNDTAAGPDRKERESHTETKVAGSNERNMKNVYKKEDQPVRSTHCPDIYASCTRTIDKYM